MNRRKIVRDPDETSSYSELKELYSSLVSSLDEAHRRRRAAESLLRERRAEASEAKTEVRKVKSKLDTITRKQAAQEQVRATAGWSGAAIGMVTLTWEGFGVYGYPGPAWFFQSEIVLGAACWISTTVFHWAAKCFYGAD